MKHRSAVNTGMPEWEYREWCRENRLDPESLDSVLAYEDLFDPTDEDQFSN